MKVTRASVNVTRASVKSQALELVQRDLKKFPNNPTLKHLKNEILGKHSAKTTRQPAPKKPKPKR